MSRNFITDVAMSGTLYVSGLITEGTLPLNEKYTLSGLGGGGGGGDLTQAVADTLYVQSGLNDPHPQYLTTAEADVQYVQSGLTGGGGITQELADTLYVQSGLTDPFPLYLLASDKATLSRGVTIVDVVSTDDATLMFTPVALTVNSLYTHTSGGTEAEFNIKHHTNREVGIASNNVFASGVTIGDEAGQQINTGFADNTIPANSWIWLDVSGVTGSMDMFHTTMIYTED